MTNPLYDRLKVPETTTINGIPALVLHGRLPEPYACPECDYPVWDLDDPYAVPAEDGSARVRLAMRAEWSSVCFGAGRGHVVNLVCNHPYHLVQHRCSQFRPHPAFPEGLIVSARDYGRPGSGK